MVPNHNYFEMYHIDTAFADVSVWDYGYSYLVLKVCRDSGLLECLSQAFGSHAMDIVVMAAYIIREGNAMDGLDDWQQRNFFSGFTRLAHLSGHKQTVCFGFRYDNGRIFSSCGLIWL